ncbi:MAG: hypothetical protein HQL12_08930 [Candidatus Omnitrophica bacterium]|nr:hypothetical protein [Candidatus Omnitrophota bacterium]
MIEIIIVLIIIGILAAIALPNIYIWIERSNAVDAQLSLKNCKDQIETCYLAHLNMSQCISSIAGSGQCNSVKFQIYAPYIGTPPPYMLAALRHDPSGVNTPIANDPGGAMHCQWNADQSAGASETQSGIGLCRNTDGTFTTSSWGLYQGM